MTVLITGTSSGIGLALANEYLEFGHTVYGISRRYNEKLGRFSSFHFLSLDLSDHNLVNQKLPDFVKDIKELDLVVLNAGIIPEIKDMKDTSLEEIHEVMDINTWVNKIIIDQLFRELENIKQLVAISSGASVSGSRGWNAYSLSKATMNMLINLYSKEHTSTHFSSIAPGIIDTAMQDYIYGLKDEERFPVVKKLKSLKGTKQMPSPEKAVPKLVTAFKKALAYESGGFFDVREM